MWQKKSNDKFKPFLTEDTTHSIEVATNQDRLRADKAILSCLGKTISRNQLHRLFAAGLVWREEQALRKSDKVFAGELLQLTVPAVCEPTLRPVPIPLKVIYEDHAIIAINKAPGMVVHPGAGTGDDTLVHALLFHCSGNLSGIGGVARPGIVHRLDKETSGVIVAAKTDAAFEGLARQFAERQTRKTYYAIVSRIPAPRKGRVEAPIGRHPVSRLKMSIRPDGREAISEYEVEKEFPPSAAMCRVRIHTGRTHQIRVHLASLGHPILGDTLYGYKASATIQVPRILLHAFELILQHPVSGETLFLRAPLPPDMAEFPSCPNAHTKLASPSANQLNPKSSD